MVIVLGFIAIQTSDYVTTRPYHYSVSFLMEADHDQQTPRIGREEPARPGRLCRRSELPPGFRQSRRLNQAFRLCGQVVKGLWLLRRNDLAARI
jgi:hypothetical protein